MKIVFISDTHNKHHRLTEQLAVIGDIDVIVHAGDISSRGYSIEVEDFLEWYDTVPAKHKIFIAGNHDWLFQDSKKEAKRLLDLHPEIHYLENSHVVIDGVKFYGAPATPTFHNWAFNYDRGDSIREQWLKIPLDTDVLITHGPVKGILDYVIKDHVNVGCYDLLDVIQSQVNPKIHVCGHIHCGHGMQIQEATTFINAAILDEQYNVANHPIVLNL